MEIQQEEEVITNPFLVFPEELWDVILEELDDSVDIWNALEAYPALKTLSERKQYDWLIGRVLPLLFPKYLNLSHIETCLFVSRRWRNAVSTTLETHPDRLPYQSNRLGLITETHFNFQPIPPITLTANWTHLKSTLENNLGMSTNYENPFPGRFVYSTVICDRDGLDLRFEFHSSCPTSPKNVTTDICQVLPLLPHFGSHIWHITVDMNTLVGVPDQANFTCQVLKPLFQALASLPNLKSVKISQLSFSTYDMTQGIGKEFSDYLKGTILPFRLESLDLWENYNRNYENAIHLHSHIIMTLVNHAQIKNLAIHLDFWSKEYTQLFPNLSELAVKHADKQGLKNILEDLKTSPIKKLRIKTELMFTNDIVEILSSYQIESLEIIGELKENVQQKVSPIQSLQHYFSHLFLKTHALNIPSIRSVSLKLMRTSSLGLRFLNSFSSLQYLTVNLMSVKQSRTDWEDVCDNLHTGDEFLNCVSSFYTDHTVKPDNFKIVWCQWPELRILTVRKGGRTYRYAAECPDNVFVNSNKNKTQIDFYSE